MKWSHESIYIEMMTRSDFDDIFYRGGKMSCYINGNIELIDPLNIPLFNDFKKSVFSSSPTSTTKTLVVKNNKHYIIGMIHLYDLDIKNGVGFVTINTTQHQFAKEIYEIIENYLKNYLRFHKVIATVTSKDASLIHEIQRLKYPYLGKLEQKYYENNYFYDLQFFEVRSPDYEK